MRSNEQNMERKSLQADNQRGEDSGGGEGRGRWEEIQSSSLLLLSS